VKPDLRVGPVADRADYDDDEVGDVMISHYNTMLFRSVAVRGRTVSCKGMMSIGKRRETLGAWESEFRGRDLGERRRVKIRRGREREQRQ
jgi:hypothetical protein